MSALEDFIKSYRGPGFRIGKQLRMRGAGYTTIHIGDLAPDEKRCFEIIEAMPPEDAAVLGRVIDASWYAQNERDLMVLEAKAKDAQNA